MKESNAENGSGALPSAESPSSLAGATSEPQPLGTSPAGNGPAILADTFGAFQACFARDLAAAVQSLLGWPVRIRLLGVSEFDRSGSGQSLDEPTCCFTLEAAAVTDKPATPSAGQSPACVAAGWLAFAPQIAFAILDRLLGSTGKQVYIPSRPLTSVERRLMRRVVALAAGIVEKLITEAQGRQRETRPVSGRAAQESMAAPLGDGSSGHDTQSRDGAQRVFAFEASVGKQTGLLRLCVPAEAMASPPAPAVRPGQGASPLELSATVDQQVDAAEMAQLGAGDILITDTPADGEVTLRTAGIPKFVARLGACDGQRAATVIRRLSQGDPKNPETPGHEKTPTPNP